MDRRAPSIVIIAVIVIALAAGTAVADQDEDIPHNDVRNWALKFGIDLFEFSRQHTRMPAIKDSYKNYEIDVVRKDGIILLRELAAEVKNFMEFKMNAVMRIMDSAEQAALSENDRESSQGANSGTGFYGHLINEYNSDGRLADGAKEMLLKPMRRFESLGVNLSLSSILVPQGIDLDGGELKSAISWSSHLDPLFANNLERDPALSWQYFGSRQGFLRRFPATAWPPEDLRSSKFINDFRTVDWFIQAASSPKDILILMDSSGSMSGRSYQLAIETASAILDTLGDDDFVTLIAFSDVTRPVVPCFKNKMVRATPDNIKEMKDASKAVKCENVANFTAALENAFELLHWYNQSGEGSQCNQAIMLITDGTTESHAEIIKHYNWPHMPVRLFTYLIGGDSGSKEHMFQMACTNKGFYTQINSAEDARERVLDYALVMARPMVLYQAEHPVHWSPVFVGGRSGMLGRDALSRRRLVTSVTTPVFDRRNHSVRVANLLGVVGTDVPIEEIQKMIPQHKLGVNGYSFIVDNNGRVLYHPDLRPTDDGIEYSANLKPKYMSIDLTELEVPEMETANGNIDPGNANENLMLDLRQEMVSQEDGETAFTVLKHLEDMKRVLLRPLRYFYGPIDGTPFSLAIALPEKYGMNEFKAQQEIRHSHVNVTEYFKGDNWRVHPDWVYCEYNTYNDLEREKDSSGEITSRERDRDREDTFETPEEQVLHFLARAGRPGWKWMSVRPRSPQPHHGPGGIPLDHFAQHPNNGQGSRKAEPYYCDRNLIQSLVQDAIFTEQFDKNLTDPKNTKNMQLGYKMFTVSTSFVATRSGLLRWKDHIPPDINEPEINARAIDMAWYKRAVDQHFVDPESFVFSVPFNSGYSGKESGTMVTASHAIFIDHKGIKAPAGVVGLQISHESLSGHFINITSKCTVKNGCRKTCASDELDCYILDNNGFVILSENTEHTGRFFGQIDGTIMDSLVQDRIYRRIPLINYQGVCSDKDNPYFGTSNRLMPAKPFAWIMEYLMQLSGLWFTLMPLPVISWPQTYGSHYSKSDSETDDDFEDANYSDEYGSSDSDYTNIEAPAQPTPVTPDNRQTPVPRPPQSIPATGPRVVPDTQHARPCDLKTDLYVLQPERLNSNGQNNPLKGKLTNCHSSGCERPFSVQKIPHSNLILLVVDTLCPCGSKQLDIEPQEMAGGAGACGIRRQSKERLLRKKPPKCINYHPEEIEIQQCGRATSLVGISIFSSFAIFAFVSMITHA